MTDKLFEKLLVNFGMTVVLGEIARVMTFGENAHHSLIHAERMRECLKHDVPIFRAVSMPPQGGKREAVRGAIGQIKPAFGREIFIAGIGQTLPCGIDQPVKFHAWSRLPLELADFDEILKFPSGHAPVRPPIQR